MSVDISRDAAYSTAIYHLTYGDPAEVLGKGWWRKHGSVYGPSMVELHDIYHDPKAVVTGGEWVLTKQAVRTMDDVMTAVELLIRWVKRVNDCGLIYANRFDSRHCLYPVGQLLSLFVADDAANTHNPDSAMSSQPVRRLFIDPHPANSISYWRIS